MSMQAEKTYTVTSDGISNLCYEDSYCKVKLVVADFREDLWWISAHQTLNKETNSLEKLSKTQKHEWFRRVSAAARNELYTDEFKFIKEDMENVDFTISILDLK